MFARIRVYLIMFAAFATFAGVFYWYYQDSQKALKVYAENQAKLETALATQQAAYDSLRSDLELLQKTQTELLARFEDSRRLTAALETLFDKDSSGNPRDFGELAAENPELVTEELNTGTQEVFNCFEQLSGGRGDSNDTKYIDCFDNSNSTNSMQ